MNTSKSFIFMSAPMAHATDDTLVMCVEDEVLTTKKLFENYKNSLRFPSYFGSNWNALFDFLRDLQWIEETNVVIVHQILPALPNSEMRIYLELLRDVVDDWEPGERHSFNVIFKEADRASIEAMIKQS